MENEKFSENELLKRLKDINKGNEIARLAKDIEAPRKISSDVWKIDMLLGGGWPLGKLVVFFGRYGSTKSTLALWAVRNAQKMGLNCLWVDSEKSFERAWAQSYDVDVALLPVIKSKSVESILSALDEFKTYATPDVIVIDSVSSVHKSSFLDEADSKAVGLQSRATKELLLKIEYWFPNALIICISQTTIDLGGFKPEIVATGGKFLEHEANIRLYLNYSKSDIAKQEEKKVGNKIISGGAISSVDIRYEFKKERGPANGHKGYFRFIPGVGNDVKSEAFELGLLSGVIRKDNNTYLFEDTKLAVGRENAIKSLEDTYLLEAIKDEIFKRGLSGGNGKDSSDETDLP